MTTTQDIGDRTSGIGGSDMAAVLGVDPYRSPLQVYLEKTGEAENTFKGNTATDLGHRFEDDVAQIYSDRTGHKVRRDNREHRHPDHHWAMAHVDRRIVGQPQTILEVKCSSSSGWGEEGTDQIPERILPQCHHYMAVLGATTCEVAALLWGNYGPPRVQLYTVQHDPEMTDIILQAGAEFWQRVQDRRPPDPTTDAEANLRWRKVATGVSVQVEEDVVRAVAELDAIKAEAKAIKAREDAVKLFLKNAFRVVGEDGQFLSADALTYGGKVAATWKEQTSTRLDTKRLREDHPELAADYLTKSTFRVLRTTKHGRTAIKN